MNSFARWLVASIFAVSMLPGTTWAGSKVLNVQGKLANSAGSPLSSAQVIFSLYTAPSGGTPVWTNTLNIPTSNGLFNVALQDGSPSLDTLSFTTPYYLGMKVVGDTVEMTPRQPLGAAAYALGSVSDFSVGKNLVVSGNVRSAGAKVVFTSSIGFSPSSSGIAGTQTNDNAAAGTVGEWMNSYNPFTNCPASQTFGDLTSITLGPGDWDVTALLTFYANGSNLTAGSFGIGTVPLNSNTGLVDALNYVSFGNLALSGTMTSSGSIPVYRVSLATTTRLYLKVRCAYSGGTAQVAGNLSARRAR